MGLSPKYSVIVPVFNREAWIGVAIDSILEQSYRDYELIVCDDGSEDGTPSILARYGSRIRVVTTRRVGPGAARNAAAAVAHGRYLSFLDSDDLWMPWTLECVDAVLASASAQTSVYLRPRYVPGEEVPGQSVFDGSVKFGVYESFIDAPSKMPSGGGLIGAIPRGLFLAVGGFDEARVNSEDRDLALKMSRMTQYAVIESPICVNYRVHGGQLTTDYAAGISGWRMISEHYQSGLYGPTTECKLAGYMAMFFAGQVGMLLGKGQIGRDARFFWRSFKFAAGNFRRAWKPNLDKHTTCRTAHSAIRRFVWLCPFLFGIAVVYHLTGRVLGWATGWLKEPEHQSYVDETNRMPSLQVGQICRQ